jgi:mono/diheme cytochrome c family protein
MATAPADNPAWKALRSDALILAEGSNLLLLRKPEKDAEAWAKFSVDSRDAGAELVKAGKQRDFAAAKAAYEKMLTHCNACHKQFDNGKHQLEP